MQDLLKSIIHPAHKLDISVFQHVVGLAGCPQIQHRLAEGPDHRFPLYLIQPREPFPQSLIKKTGIQGKIRPQHLPEIGELIFIRIGQLAGDQQGILFPAPQYLLQERLDLRVISRDPAKIHPWLRTFFQRL